jgi:hypothetical protein
MDLMTMLSVAQYLSKLSTDELFWDMDFFADYAQCIILLLMDSDTAKFCFVTGNIL